MPSEHFIKDNENPNNILISEDEYINKYKSGQIPECCVSPYIYQKLNEINNENKINMEQNEKLEERINEEKKIIEENNIQQNQHLSNNMNIINNEERIKMNQIMIQKNIEKERFKKIVNYNWNSEEELSFPIYHSINCNKLKDITGDINKFGNKRKHFFSNISSFK